MIELATEMKKTAPITLRQREVVALIAAGCSNDEVGLRLGISPRTAKAHCDVLRQKLGVRRRRQIPIAFRLLTGEDPLSAGRRYPIAARSPADRGRSRPWPGRECSRLEGGRVDGSIQVTSVRRVRRRRQSPNAGSASVGSSSDHGCSRSWISRRRRVRMLVAPAGYGKTTFAEQWVARDGRLAAWFTARSSATDVAALALGLARSSTTIVEDCDVRLREHMRALPAPAENVETLAEILGEDLAEWPSGAWLVIDDYHEVAQEPRAEDFVAALVSVSPVQFLIASRVRPSWVSTKELMYGDVLEVNQAALAMDNEEAADVLVDRTALSASGLVSLAHGWPAVIGLASVSSAELETDADAGAGVALSLLRRRGLLALGQRMSSRASRLSPSRPFSTATSSPPCSATKPIPSSRAHSTSGSSSSARLGSISIRSHAPSSRRRAPRSACFPADSASRVCLAHYRTRRDWDAAFEVIARSGWPGELEPLVTDALDELLESARLSTLDRWCDFAYDAGLDAPMFPVARAEVHAATRPSRGSDRARGVRGESPGEHVFRALAVAGRAAHLASREEQALELYERAETVAAQRGRASGRESGASLDGTRGAGAARSRTSRFGALKSRSDLADPRELFGLRTRDFTSR